METLLAFVIGALYAAGLYMMVRRSIVRMIFGLIMLGNAANLLIFTMGRVVRGRPALIPEGAYAPPAPYADPLTQAMILTAIVIGFGVQAFALVLIKRAYDTVGSDDVDRMRTTEEPPQQHEIHSTAGRPELP